MLDLNKKKIEQARKLLAKAKHITAFTGAGISVESGIPSYRGQGGVWTKYNPQVLELNYFFKNPEDSWKHIRNVFYEFFAKAEPNIAHKTLAKWEEIGKLKAVITQNIDNLHYKAGNKNVIEFHGNSQILTCTKCGTKYPVKDINLDKIPPLCKKCKGLLKPDFIFFGEGIPHEAMFDSKEQAANADVFILIGTTGEVYPAAEIPHLAFKNRAKIIEINPEESKYTNVITDIHLKGEAGEMMKALDDFWKISEEN